MLSAAIVASCMLQRSYVAAQHVAAQHVAAQHRLPIGLWHLANRLAGHLALGHLGNGRSSGHLGNLGNGAARGPLGNLGNGRASRCVRVVLGNLGHLGDGVSVAAAPRYNSHM